MGPLFRWAAGVWVQAARDRVCLCDGVPHSTVRLLPLGHRRDGALGFAQGRLSPCYPCFARIDKGFRTLPPLSMAMRKASHTAGWKRKNLVFLWKSETEVKRKCAPSMLLRGLRSWLREWQRRSLVRCTITTGHSRGFSNYLFPGGRSSSFMA